MPETPYLDIPELKTSFLFRRRPVAIPGDLRPAWRIGLLILLLSHCCRSTKSSLARLHVLSWAIRTEQSQQDLLSVIERERNPSSLIVRFDPFLDRALDFAIGEGLITHCGGKAIELTSAGKALSLELDGSETLFLAEKKFIASVKHKVSEKLVNEVFGWKDE